MKRFKRALTFMLALAIVLSFCITGTNAAVSPNWQPLTSPHVVRFAVLSDTHIKPYYSPEEDRLAEAIQTFNALDSNLDAIAFSGDFTNYGEIAEYQKFMSIINTNKEPNTQIMIAMGNHEFYGPGNTIAKTRFTQETGEQPNEHNVINGYHFITISPDNETSYVASKTWLKTQLDIAKADGPTKPIFVFTHLHIKNTVYGSDLWYTDDLTTTLNSYPQVVHFSGHSHYATNDPRTINQNNFTAVGTGTLSYFEMEPGMVYGTVPPMADNAAQATVVEVDSTNKVTIKRLDLISDTYIGEDWVIPTPSVKTSFTYTNARATSSLAPYFEADDQATVSRVSRISALLTWDQAKANVMVHSYRIDVKNLSNNKIEKTFKVWSQFYFLPMPTTLSEALLNLKFDTPYEVKIYAIEPWGKVSATPLVTTFRTLPDTYDPNVVVPTADIIDFNFSGGVADDHSPLNNDVITSGSPVISYDSTISKYVASFPGIEGQYDYYKMPFDDTKFALIQDEVSFQTRFKVDSCAKSYQTPFGGMQYGGIGYEITPINNSTGMLDAWICINGNYQHIGVQISSGRYYDVCATYNGLEFFLYLDGKVVNSLMMPNTVTYTPYVNSKAFMIGGDVNADGNTEAAFDGTVVEAKVFSRALTADEIYKMHNS